MDKKLFPVSGYLQEGMVGDEEGAGSFKDLLSISLEKKRNVISKG